MQLSTTRDESTITYRDHRLVLHPAIMDEYFEEVVEHLAGNGVRVQIIDHSSDYEFDEWG